MCRLSVISCILAAALLIAPATRSMAQGSDILLDALGGVLKNARHFYQFDERGKPSDPNGTQPLRISGWHSGRHSGETLPCSNCPIPELQWLRGDRGPHRLPEGAADRVVSAINGGRKCGDPGTWCGIAERGWSPATDRNYAPPRHGSNPTGQDLFADHQRSRRSGWFGDRCS